jgi:hypothetical protein
MNDKQLISEDVLNECLEAVLRGESEADCLERYPQQAAELKPLLKTMVAAKAACKVTPRLEYRARARYEYRRAVAAACARQPQKSFGWRWRWTTVVPIVMALMMASGGGILAASASSLPGQPLYGVKLAVEQVRVNLETSEEGKLRVYAAQAERRVNEVVALADSGATARVGEATLRLDDTLNKVTGLMNITSAERNSFSGGAADMYPPTIASPGNSFDAAKAEAQAPAPSQALNTSDVNPALLQILKENASRNQAKLQNVIVSQPTNNTVILQHAIDSYQAILNTESAPVG